MTSLPSLIFLAAIGGFAVALQGQFMGLMDKNIGTLESVFITYVGGGVLAIVAMIAYRGGNLKAVHGAEKRRVGAQLSLLGTLAFRLVQMHCCFIPLPVHDGSLPRFSDVPQRWASDLK